MHLDIKIPIKHCEIATGFVNFAQNLGLSISAGKVKLAATDSANIKIAFRYALGQRA